VRNEFYKDSQGGVLVFDASSRASFDNLRQWVSCCCAFALSISCIWTVGLRGLDVCACRMSIFPQIAETKKYGGSRLIGMVVANKIDLKREVRFDVLRVISPFKTTTVRY